MKSPVPLFPHLIVESNSKLLHTLLQIGGVWIHLPSEWYSIMGCFDKTNKSWYLPSPLGGRLTWIGFSQELEPDDVWKSSERERFVSIAASYCCGRRAVYCQAARAVMAQCFTYMCIIICLLIGLSSSSFRQSIWSWFIRELEGMLLQSDTTEALPSSGPIDDMSISANTAAAAAASVADGLGVVVAAVTIVNIIPSSFYVLLLLATGDAGAAHTRTNKTTKLHARSWKYFPSSSGGGWASNALERQIVPNDVIFTRISNLVRSGQKQEEFQLLRSTYIQLTPTLTY